MGALLFIKHSTMSRKAKFILTDSELDRCQYERSFSGRLTKKRYKFIDRFCRKNTYDRNCGCAGDCCGHLCTQRLTFEYRYNQVVITLVKTFNY